jgi:5-methylcytosine-specific restriction endonuclease McrA
MTNTPLDLLSDSALLTETARVASVERQSTSQLLALLAELDARKLYLGQGYPSLFAYCTQVLHLSEPAAYSRITAARAARSLPVIFTLLADGALTLTTVSLLAGHLTDENHAVLLDAARHKSKREVERLVAGVVPQPDVESSLRRLRMAPAIESAKPTLVAATPMSVERGAGPLESMSLNPDASALMNAPPPARRAVVAPLSPERYLLKVTLSRETHERLERIRDLLRHSIPNGDPAAIVDRALAVLLDQLEKTKHAATRRPRAAGESSPKSRHIPAAVKRTVWKRDEGRCAFVGAEVRCRETGFLEFHHVVPFAVGGVTSVENLQLRCRAHNAYEAERDFGRPHRRRRARSRQQSTLAGQSSAKRPESRSVRLPMS